MAQFVDPAVSKDKFERQVLGFKSIENDMGRRGCWILTTQFPLVFAIFGTPKLKPPSIVFGALIDFTNYDMCPPSVRLVDPFTREPYTFGRLPNYLNRAAPLTNPAVPTNGQQQLSVQPLMQAFGPDEIPFFCIPGVREYHEHPAHSGDSWLLHRKSPEGTLFFILEQLLKYGVEPIAGYQMNLKISIGGYTQAVFPQ